MHSFTNSDVQIHVFSNISARSFSELSRKCILQAIKTIPLFCLFFPVSLRGIQNTNKPLTFQVCNNRWLYHPTALYLSAKYLQITRSRLLYSSLTLNEQSPIVKVLTFGNICIAFGCEKKRSGKYSISLVVFYTSALPRKLNIYMCIWPLILIFYILFVHKMYSGTRFQFMRI